MTQKIEESLPFAQDGTTARTDRDTIESVPAGINPLFARTIRDRPENEDQIRGLPDTCKECGCPCGPLERRICLDALEGI